MPNETKKLNIKKLSEMLRVPEEEFKEWGVVDVNPFHDSPIFVNADRVLKTEIPEFKNSKQSIIQHVFVNAIRLGELRETFPPEEVSKNKRGVPKYKFDAQYSVPLSKWKTSENHRSYFGTAETEGNGKGMGIDKKDNFIKGFNMYLRRIFENIGVNNNKARVFNFLAIYVDNVGVDNLSDLLINALNDEFREYTNFIIEKLGVPSEFVHIEEGKKILKLYNEERERSEFKYFYPVEFMTDIPMVEVRDIKNAPSLFVDESWDAVAEILKGPQNNVVTDVERKKLSDSMSVDKVLQILDFTEFRSMFLKQFKPEYDKGAMIELFKVAYADDMSPNSFVDGFVNTASELISKSKTDLFMKEGRLSEGKFQSVVELLLNASSLKHRFTANAKMSINGERDLEIIAGNSNTLLELKVLNEKSKINTVVNNYDLQIKDYSEQKSFDSSYFILLVNNLSTDDLSILVDELDKVNYSENDINRKYIIIAMGETITASKQSRVSSYSWKSKVITKKDDLERYNIPTNAYRENIMKLKTTFQTISGKTVNSVITEVIQQNIDAALLDNEKYLRVIKNLQMKLGIKIMSYVGENNITLKEIKAKFKKELDEKNATLKEVGNKLIL